MKTAIVSIKDVYGKRTIYPENESAQLFARIAGTKTLTQPTIDNMKKLGYDVYVKKESL